MLIGIIVCAVLGFVTCMLISPIAAVLGVTLVGFALFGVGGLLAAIFGLCIDMALLMILTYVTDRLPE